MNKKLFPNSLIQSLLVFLIFFVINGVIVSVLGLLTDNLDLKITLNFTLSFLCTFLVIYLVNKKRGVSVKFSFRVKNYKMLFLSSLVVVTYVLGISTPIYKSFLLPLFNGAGEELTNPFNNLPFTISTIILAPVLEEILFRGLFLKGFLLKYSAKKAIIVSTILFAVIHLLPSQIINALLLGLFFGFIYYKTKSIGYTIVLHFLANLTSFVAGYINFKNAKSVSSPINDVYGDLSVYIIVVSVIILIFSSIMLKKTLKNDNLTSTASQL